MKTDDDTTDLGKDIDPQTGNFISNEDRSGAQETEYGDALVSVEALGYVDDPAALAKTIAGKMFSLPYVRNSFGYDEIFHETIVAMYMAAIGDSPPQNESDFITSVFNAVGRFTGKKEWATRRETLFSEMERDDDDRTVDFPDQNETLQNENSEESTLSEERIEEIKEILAKSEAKKGQTEKDMDVLVRFLDGESIEYIQTQCPWLKSEKSVEAALTRILETLRNFFGADPTNPIELEPEGKLWTKERRRKGTSQKEYFGQWYEKNREAKKEKMREYMRSKRAKEKVGSEEIPTDTAQ